MHLGDAAAEKEMGRVDGKGWVTQAVFSSAGNLVMASGGIERMEDRKCVNPSMPAYVSGVAGWRHPTK
jgi:hypothetical protein